MYRYKLQEQVVAELYIITLHRTHASNITGFVSNFHRYTNKKIRNQFPYIDKKAQPFFSLQDIYCINYKELITKF